MPTTRDSAPRHGFSFVLTIPLLPLFVAIPPAAVDTGCAPVSVQSVPLAFQNTAVPVPWEDDVFTDGIPPDSSGNDIPRRKDRFSRAIPRDEWIGGRLPLRSGAALPRLVLIETLLDAFLIGLPPPGAAPGV